MIHDFTNTTNSHLVLGDAPNRLVIAPGATAGFEADNLTAEDLGQIDAGDFTVSPALPAGLQNSLQTSSQSTQNQLVEYVISRDDKIEFDDTPSVSGVDTAPHDYELSILDATDILDTFNDVAEVTVFVCSSPSDGTINTPQPIKFENGKATVSVSRVEASVRIAITSGPAGVATSDTLLISS